MRQTHRYASAILAASLSAACARTPDLVGTPTGFPAADAAVVKTLQVAPSRVECTGVGPQTCLQVRESADAPWTLLYDAIHGFDYEPGFLYEIRIKEEAVANPPADASSIRRTLVALLSKTPAAPLVGTTWRLSSIEGRPALDGVRVTAVFGDDSRVTGSAGCNGYFGSAVVKGESITVGRLASTLKACGAAGVMAQEQAYMDALGKITVYRVAGTELQMGPAPGAATLVFKRE